MSWISNWLNMSRSSSPSYETREQYIARKEYHLRMLDELIATAKGEEYERLHTEYGNVAWDIHDAMKA